MRLAALLLPALLGSAAAMAQPAPCANPGRPWRDAAVLEAAARSSELPDTRLEPGRAATLHLHTDGEVAYLTLPRGEGEEASYGGMAAFTVVEAGTYGIGLSEPAWVDAVRDGAPVEAAAFGPGPECSGIRKQVAFVLEPGSYVLEVSGNLEPEVGVLISRVQGG